MTFSAASVRQSIVRSLLYSYTKNSVIEQGHGFSQNTQKFIPLLFLLLPSAKIDLRLLFFLALVLHLAKREKLKEYEFARAKNSFYDM